MKQQLSACCGAAHEIRNIEEGRKLTDGGGYHTDVCTNCNKPCTVAETPNQTDKETESWEKQVIEQLAAIEHQRWTDWQSYVHSKCVPSADDGIWLIGESFIERWERQIKTPYSELSEEEKNSDRKQVMRYWPIISSLLAKQKQELVDKIRQVASRHTFPDDGIEDEERLLIDAEPFWNAVEELTKHV